MQESRDDAPALLVESLPASLGELLPLGREATLEQGALLFPPGGLDGEIAVLLEGRLEVLQGSEEEAVVLRHVFPGAVVAEARALEGQPRFTRLRAVTASRVLLLAKARFQEFLRRQPELLETLFWLQVRRTRSLPWRPSRVRTLLDPRTGLYDQAFFCERLVTELERAQLTGDTVVVVHSEIDDLPAYAAARGSAAAERVIRKIAEILRQTGRRGDLSAQCGDTEYLTLLYAASASDGWRFAEAFRGAVMGTGFAHQPGRPPDRLTVSAGVAVFPQDAQDELGLLDAARARREAARCAGGNCTIGVGARATP